MRSILIPFTLLLVIGLVVGVVNAFIPRMVWNRVTRGRFHSGLNLEIHMGTIGSVFKAGELAEILNARADVPIVVDFQKSNCKPCIKMAPDLDAMAAKYDGKMKFYKVDADSSKDALRLMKEQGIRAVPTFHVYSAGGRVDTINGARLDEVEESFRSILKKQGVELPEP